jgi:hypothetical protein
MNTNSRLTLTIVVVSLGDAPVERDPSTSPRARAQNVRKDR